MATPTTFQRCHVWLLDNAADELGVIGANLNGDAIKELAIRYFALCVKLQDGQSEINQGVIPKIRQRMTELGVLMLVGGWSQNRTNAIADADKSNGLITRETADFWISACEFEYKGEPGSENYKRTGQFVDRALQTDALGPYMKQGKWGFCSLPNEPNGHWFDWAAVKRGGGRWIPQCYPNEFPHAPSQWPHEAQKVGVQQFAPSYIHPVIGEYPGVVPVTAGQYLQSLTSAKRYGFTFGFGIYGSHHLSKEDWDAYARTFAAAGTNPILAWY
jgi:hypothetical protein